jgi:hypothetical protein
MDQYLEQYLEGFDDALKSVPIVSAEYATLEKERDLLKARVTGLELALNQIKNSCVDDDDEANALFRLSPAELRKIAVAALAGTTS